MLYIGRGVPQDYVHAHMWSISRGQGRSGETHVCATLHQRCPFSKIGIMNDGTIVVAGATGNLGGRIVRAILERRASVTALVRQGTPPERLDRLRELGVRTITSVDFTTMDDTAAFTASAALDPSTPRFLRIAGDQLSARELTAVVSEVTGKEFRSE